MAVLLNRAQYNREKAKEGGMTEPSKKATTNMEDPMFRSAAVDESVADAGPRDINAGCCTECWEYYNNDEWCPWWPEEMEEDPFECTCNFFARRERL